MPVGPSTHKPGEYVRYTVDDTSPKNADGALAQRIGLIQNAEDRGNADDGSDWYYNVLFSYEAVGTIDSDTEFVAESRIQGAA